MLRKGATNFKKLISTCLIIKIGFYIVVEKIYWYLPITLFLISNVAYIIATKMDIAQMLFVHDDDLGLTK